jgi:hypothetical protein
MERQEEQGMPIGKATLFLIPVAGYVGLFIGLHALLGIESVWLGLLLLWYWGMEKHAGLEPLLKTILPGALVGVGVAYSLEMLPERLGTPGTALTVVLIAGVVLCTLTGQAAMFVNGATFLCLAVIMIPAISKTSADFLDMFGAVAVSCTYIGLSAWGMQQVRRVRAKSP